MSITGERVNMQSKNKPIPGVTIGPLAIEFMRSFKMAMNENMRRVLPEKAVAYAIMENIVSNDSELYELDHKLKSMEKEIEAIKNKIADREDRQDYFMAALNKEINEEEFNRWYKAVTGHEVEYTID